MEEDNWYHRGILVSNLPTSDDMTKDKLEIHFSKRSNEGGDVENIIMLDEFTAMVLFKEEKTMNSVLAKSAHRLLDSILNVTRYTHQVADDLKASSNDSLPGLDSFGSSNEDIADSGDEFDGLDQYEPEERETIDKCTCYDLFKIFEEVSVSIPLDNLEARLPKTNTLNRMSVRTGVKWEIDNSNKKLLLFGKFDEVKNAAERLQIYINDKEDRQVHRGTHRHPTLKLRSSMPHLKRSESPLLLTGNVTPNHRDQLPDMQEESPDDSIAEDLEADGPYDVNDENSEKSWSSDTDLEQSSLELVMRKECLSDNIAKEDVVRLDPKMAHYVMNVYKTQVELIQTKCSVQFKTADKGQITLEFRRDDSTADDARRAIQDFNVIVDEIITQDLQPQTVNLNDFDLPEDDLKRICHEAKQSNPGITLMQLEDARIQMYGPKLMVTNAVKWFGANVVTPAMRGRHYLGEPVRERQHDAKGDKTIDPAYLGNVAPKVKPHINTEPSREDRPDAVNGYMPSNEVKLSDASIKHPRKEETKLVKSVYGKLEERQPITGRNSPPKDTTSTEKSTNNAKPTSRSHNQTIISKALPSAISKSRLNSNDRNDKRPKTKPVTPPPARQFVEETFAQKTLDYIQAIHYEDINTISSKYKVRFESKSNAKVEIHPQIVKGTDGEMLRLAMIEFKELVESVGDNLLTKVIDLNTLDMPQKDVEDGIREIKQNQKVMAVERAEGRLEFVGTAEDREIAVENLTSSAKPELPTATSVLEKDVVTPTYEDQNLSMASGLLPSTMARSHSPALNSSDVSQRPDTPPSSPPPTQVAVKTFEKKILEFIRVAHYKDINVLSITYDVEYNFKRNGEVEIRPQNQRFSSCKYEKLQLAMAGLTTLVDSIKGKLVTKIIDDFRDVNLAERHKLIKDAKQSEKVLVTTENECQIEIYGTAEHVQNAVEIIFPPTQLGIPTKPSLHGKDNFKTKLTSQSKDQTIASGSLPSTTTRSHSLLNSSDLRSQRSQTPTTRQVIEEIFDQKTLDFIQVIHYKDINELSERHNVTFEMTGNGNVAVRPRTSAFATSANSDLAMSSLRTLVKSLKGKLITQTMDLRDFDVPKKNVDVTVAHAKQNENVIVTDGPGCKIELFGAREHVKTAKETFVKHVNSGVVDGASSGSARVFNKQIVRATNCKFESESRSKKDGRSEASFVRSSDRRNNSVPQSSLIPRGGGGTSTNIYDTAESDAFDFQEGRRNKDSLSTNHHTNDQFCVPKSTSVTIWPRSAITAGDDNWEDGGDYEGHLVNNMGMYGDVDDPSKTAQCEDRDSNGLGSQWYEGDLKSVVVNERSSKHSRFDEACAIGYDDDDAASGGLIHDISNYGELDNDPYEASAVATASSSPLDYRSSGDTTSHSDSLILRTSAGFDLEIRHGDITLEFVSIIVTSADPHLGNQTSVARAVKERAGPELARACRKWVESRGPVDSKRPVYTDAGNLTCNRVLHVVPPSYSDPMEFERGQKPISEMLDAVMRTCLRMPETKSIAMPAIGIDSLQMNKKRYAEALFDAIVGFIQSPSSSHSQQRNNSVIERLIIVDKNASLVDILKSFFAWKSSNPIFSRLFQPRVDGSGVGASIGHAQSSIQQINTGARHKSHHGSGRRHSSSRKNRHQQFTENRGLNQNGDSRGMAATFSRGDEDMATSSLSVTRTQYPKDTDDDNTSDDDNKCPVCLSPVSKPWRKLKCNHTFCKSCLDQSIKHQGQTCPVCKKPFGKGKRVQTMPPGKMDVTFDKSTRIPGFSDSQGSIIITYTFTNGTQGDIHPHPGRSYHGTSRTAYLPDNEEGRAVLGLLKRAFDRKLTFTIGTSSSTGQQDIVIWNDIHHKTAVTGGAENHGYPDPTYLARVAKELEDKGIR